MDQKSVEISPFRVATGNGTNGGGDGGDDDNNGPRRAVLHNPLILQHIFFYLDFRQVKEVRLVCKAWEAEGSTILGKQCRLPLDRLFNDYNTYRSQPMALNPKLLQCIYIKSPNDEYEEDDLNPFPDNVAIQCFKSFASTWAGVLCELLVIMDVNIYIGLAAILNAYEFPNLTKIAIRVALGVDVDPDGSLALQPIDSLKELKIMGPNFIKSCRYPLLQNLIDSAPNLEVLDIDGNYYPHLASCSKLKVLKWIGKEYRTGETNGRMRVIELDEVFRMFDEVGNHLEHFTSSFVPIANCRGDKFNQCFPKLKSLSSNGVDSLQVLANICPSLLPKLESISCLRVQEVFDLDGLDQDSYLTHEGVNSLELCVVERPDLLTVASRKFPNVKRLVIRIADPEGKVSLAGVPFLGTILEACTTWKLAYLEIRIRKRCNLSQLLGGLKSLSVLEGIKQVRILGEQLFFHDDLKDFQEFKDVLKLGAKMAKLTFQGFPLKPATKKMVIEFLNGHKDLPVSYLFE